MKKLGSGFLMAAILLLISNGLLLSQEKSRPETRPEARLEKLWEIDEGLATPESVIFDSDRSCLYISNFNDRGGFRQRTDTLRDEYISRIDLEGNILEEKWVDKLLGPTGLAIHEDKLYVVERGAVAVVNISTGKITRRIPVPGTVFLNDIVMDAKGDIYLTDSRPDGRIHRIRNHQAEVWLQDTLLQNSNGLFLNNGHLIAGTRGLANLIAISLSDKSIDILASNMASGIDGIRRSGKDWIISWRYEIFLLDEQGRHNRILLTEETKDWNADLEYIPGQRMLIVPTLGSNKLIAYRFSEK